MNQLSGRRRLGGSGWGAAALVFSTAVQTEQMNRLSGRRRLAGSGWGAAALDAARERLAVCLDRVAALTAAVAFVVVSACQQVAGVPPPPAIPAPVPASDLWAAAAVGDIGTLETHLSRGTDLDALHPEFGIPALVAAAVGDQVAALDWLLAHGADVDARTGDGSTTLQAAAFLGNAPVARRLLEAGVDVSATNDNGQTVWQTLATDWETTDAVANLYDLSLDRQSVASGRAAIDEMLAPHLEELASEDIWLAAASGNVDAVRTNIGGGVEVNQRNADGATLLTVAAIFGHDIVAAVLLEAGAEVNARNRQNGATALHAAAFLGHAEVVQTLLAGGADPSLASDNGGTAIAAARLDWPTTRYVAGLLQIPAGDEASVMAGKAAVVELLRAELGE